MTRALGPFLHRRPALGVLRLGDRAPILRIIVKEPRQAVGPDKSASLFGLLDRRIGPRLAVGNRVEGGLLFHLLTLLEIAGRPA
jgi:hypothetical protein